MVSPSAGASPPITDPATAANNDAQRWDRAFARAAGSAPSDFNAVRLLLDAGENFPAWLEAINKAERYILFESYLILNDPLGRLFAEALAARAKDGVRVCAIFDWLGSWGGRALWAQLREAGVQMRSFNPPRFDSPLAWLSRDHRKSIIVDGNVGFVSGLCIDAAWEGDPEKRMEPWRDTGVEIRGPAVADLEHAFVAIWNICGGEAMGALPAAIVTKEKVGDVRVRVVAGVPGIGGTYRLDLLVASVARRQLWLTDAYFVGTSAYTQALRAAAADGVDVRLLVPGASDIPALSPLSRAGYRPLLESGVRVFEWNGTMLHAKTAVADGTWARVGSTNLNLASWMSNYELDVAIENAAFAQAMATQYEMDLDRATEIVLTSRNRVRRSEPRAEVAKESGTPMARRAASGSAGRAAAGAVSVGSALGAALTNRRTLGAAEAGLLGTMAVIVLGFVVVAALWPRVIAWPLAVIGGWLALSWLLKSLSLWRGGRNGPEVDTALNPRPHSQAGRSDHGDPRG
ncbi:MAG: phospholipase D-like domain-containing protein [Betaproteobacteria bacterium]